MNFWKIAESHTHFTWRLKFALIPVRRYTMKDGFVCGDGWYWWRVVYQVKVGLVPDWTTYASYNDE